MSLRSENYPYIYFRGKVTTFQRSKKWCPTYFGGPSEFSTEGSSFGPRPLHQVLVLSTRGWAEEDLKLESDLIFQYGLNYNGCYLKYKTGYRNLEIIQMEPTNSCDDWPYLDYPALLPYVPLEIKGSRECSLSEFSDSVMQGIDKMEELEVVVVVPPNPEIGMSLWGPSGDANGVQIVFRHDPSTGITEAYSACT